MKCKKCNDEIEAILPDIAHSSCLKLMDYFMHEYMEGEITEASFNDLCDAVSFLRPFCGKPEVVIMAEITLEEKLIEILASCLSDNDVRSRVKEIFDAFKDAGYILSDVVE